MSLAVIYALCAATWIITSDWALSRLGLSFPTWWASTAKGLAFVAVTATLLFILAFRHLQTIRRSHDSLSASESRYRFVTESNIIGIITYHANGRISEANDEFLRLTGFTRGDFREDKINWRALTPPEFAALDEAALDQIQATGRCTPFEKEYLRKDGSRVPVLIGAACIPGAPDAGICFILDITSRRQAEEAQRRTEERFRLVFHRANIGIALIDRDGFLVETNRALRAMLGYTGDEFRHLHYSRIIHPDDRPAADVRFARLFAAEPVDVAIERRLVAHDGQILWARHTASIIRDEQERPLYIVAMMEDVTLRRQTEEALRTAKETAETARAAADTARLHAEIARTQAEDARAQAEQANAAKDRFLAVLSHELRTPLTPVLATITAWQNSPHLANTLSPQLDVLRRNVELEARLIDDLLDLTRITHGNLRLQLQSTDLHAVIQNAIDICRNDIDTTRLTLQVQLDAPRHTFNADPARLLQVVWNILKNAIKFTPPGGTVTLRTANPDPEHVAITCTDTGIGIDPSNIERIFNPFDQAGQSTRKYGGLGVGLSLSKSIVDQHRGSLVASSAGRNLGATFTVNLPLQRCPATNVPPAAPPPPAAKGLRLLLVEDHPDTARTMSLLLKSLGHQVSIAHTVAAGLQTYDPAAFDIMISDIGLPDGTGLDLLITLRQRYADRSIRAIALSGFGMAEDVQRSKDAGFLEHLTKPISLDALESAMARAANLAASEIPGRSLETNAPQ